MFTSDGASFLNVRPWLSLDPFGSTTLRFFTKLGSPQLILGLSAGVLGSFLDPKRGSRRHKPLAILDQFEPVSFKVDQFQIRPVAVGRRFSETQNVEASTSPRSKSSSQAFSKSPLEPWMSNALLNFTEMGHVRCNRLCTCHYFFKPLICTRSPDFISYENAFSDWHLYRFRHCYKPFYPNVGINYDLF